MSHCTKHLMPLIIHGLHNLMLYFQCYGFFLPLFERSVYTSFWVVFLISLELDLNFTFLTPLSLPLAQDFLQGHWPTCFLLYKIRHISNVERGRIIPDSIFLSLESYTDRAINPYYPVQNTQK